MSVYLDLTNLLLFSSALRNYIVTTTNHKNENPVREWPCFLEVFMMKFWTSWNNNYALFYYFHNLLEKKKKKILVNLKNWDNAGSYLSKIFRKTRFNPCWFVISMVRNCDFIIFQNGWPEAFDQEFLSSIKVDFLESKVGQIDKYIYWH